MKKARSTFRRKPFVDDTPPIAAIAEEMLSAAFGADLARLAAGEPLVVAVLVPPVWLPHVVDAFLMLAPMFEVAQPPFDATRAVFLDAVCIGEATAAFAPRLSDLPDPIASVADMIVEMEPPTAAVLRAVVRRLTGVDPGPVPVDLGAGLSPEVIAACCRTGTPARRIVARLASLGRAPATAKEARAADDGPRLEDLFGYGRAKDWGLALRDGLVRMRAGEIRFTDLPAPGAVLSGPPGTGKSSFARALARSCALTLVETSVGRWFSESSGYLDGVVKAASRTFAHAQEVAGGDAVLLLLDEIDTIPDRRILSERGREYWTTLITHLLALSELGAASRDRIVLIGATNHAAVLDPALVRPGRFEQVFTIALPDAEAIAGILAVHAPELAEPDRSALAPLLAGRTGADIAALARDARAAAGLARERLGPAHVLAAAVPDDGRSVGERRSTAIHEAGHAVVAAAVGMEISTVSILATDETGGRMSGRMPSGSPTRGQLEAFVTVVLAGRAADELYGDGPSAGACSDLATATQVLADLHGAFGLGDSLLAIPSEMALRALVEDGSLRRAVEADLVRLYGAARAVLLANAAAHARLVDALVAKRLVSGMQAHAAMGLVVPAEMLVAGASRDVA